MPGSTTTGDRYVHPMSTVPDKPSLDGLEAKWGAEWERAGAYRFDRSSTAPIYAIDTPPPTVSGELHLGTVFGYVQVDAVARFHRMRGESVFYPIGWDDNGLPTERRVQNLYNVRCDPTLAYDPDATYTLGTKEQRLISRRNFLELCERQTAIDEESFESVFRQVGLSVDWTLLYTTINENSRRVAEQGFLRNLQRGEAYSAEAPTLWDVDFQTAVAQAELEDRPTRSAYVRLRFGDIEVETTRPELLAACVAVVVNPGDERFTDRVGQEVLTPLFGVSVPVVSHHLADPEKGTGAAMICTFGDTTDVVWWRELGLPMRSVIQRSGRFQEDTPAWLPGPAHALWPELAGLHAKQARRRITELLAEKGELIGEPRPIEHDVKYYEKGERPLEVVTSRQWYIRNSARDEALRDALIAKGRELVWNPPYMRTRYEHWVNGLNTDWLISRQRFFGVPFPVWYPVGDDGEPQWDAPILADEASLPVDPQADVPPGFDAAQRGQPGGFVGDPDIMDTWATSSLTPQIASGWVHDPELFERAFPMDLRPQGPEIIRTWLFSTLLRAYFEHGSLPWTTTTINGWILDPDRKKMSKSKGNVVTPAALVGEHGADGVRYWSTRAAPGTDTAVDGAQMRVGRRLAIKVLNATRFVLGLGDEIGDVTAPLDRALLLELAGVVDTATAAFEGYQYNQALDAAEAFFWRFCDDYLELVKARAYGHDDGARSANGALRTALSVLQRLLAPFLPFATEEAWSWSQPGSIHNAAWPSADELRTAAGDAAPLVFDAAAWLLGEVRKAKSEAKCSMKTPAAVVSVQAPDEDLVALTRGRGRRPRRRRDRGPPARNCARPRRQGRAGALAADVPADRTPHPPRVPRPPPRRSRRSRTADRPDPGHLPPVRVPADRHPGRGADRGAARQGRRGVRPVDVRGLRPRRHPTRHAVRPHGAAGAVRRPARGEAADAVPRLPGGPGVARRAPAEGPVP